VTTAYGVHFDPFNRKRQFITYTDITVPQREWRRKLDQFDDGRAASVEEHDVLGGIRSGREGHGR
jgi:hypothetical protein